MKDSEYRLLSRYLFWAFFWFVMGALAMEILGETFGYKQWYSGMSRPLGDLLAGSTVGGLYASGKWYAARSAKGMMKVSIFGAFDFYILFLFGAPILFWPLVFINARKLRQAYKERNRAPWE